MRSIRIPVCSVLLFLLTAAAVAQEASPVGTLLEKAQSEIEQERWDQAAKLIDAAEVLASSNPEKFGVWFTRGSMFSGMRNLDRAGAEFRKVLAVDPNHAAALNFLGYMLADAGVQLDEAYQMIRKAVDIQPKEAAYLDSLGWVEFRRGNIGEAEKYLRRAISLEDDPVIRQHLAEVLLRKGDTEGAKAVKSSEAAPSPVASPFEPFLGEWVAEGTFRGFRRFAVMRYTETKDSIVEAAIDVFGKVSSSESIPKQGARITRDSIVSSVGDVQVLPGKRWEYRREITSTVAGHTDLHRYVYSQTLNDAGQIQGLFESQTFRDGKLDYETSPHASMMYRLSDAPAAFRDLQSAEELQSRFRAAVTDLDPLLQPFRKQKYWKDNSEIGGEMSALGRALPDLWRLCDSRFSDKIKPKDEAKCLANELPKAEQTLAPFKKWIVKHAAVLQHHSRLTDGSKLDPLPIVELWAKVAGAHQKLGALTQARAEFDEALTGGINLAAAFEETFELQLKVYQAVERSSRQTRDEIEAARNTTRSGWREVLGTAVDAYVTSKTGVPATTSRAAGNNSASTQSARPTAPACGTLGSLGLRYPQTGNANLDAVRESILNTNIGDSIASAKGQGLSKAAAIAQINQQAGEADKNKAQAELCVNQSAANPEALLQRLRNRQFTGFPNADNIVTACIESFVMADMQAAANRASVQAFQGCWQ